MNGSNTQNEESGIAQNVPPEILKALHLASFNRWEKRRGYEWQLSYSIWGALAGFIAIVVFGKDSKFTSPGIAVLFPWLLLTVLAHAIYLYFIIESTLRDLKSQALLEHAMTRLPEAPAISARWFSPKKRSILECRITLLPSEMQLKVEA